MSLALQSAAGNGAVALMMGLKMTSFRGQILQRGEQVMQQAPFLKWSKAQLNNAEWAPILMVLQLALHFQSCVNRAPLSATSSFAAAGATLASISFILGVTIADGGQKGANPGKGESPAPLRVLGGIGRYVCLGVMLYRLLKEAQKNKDVVKEKPLQVLDTPTRVKAHVARSLGYSTGVSARVTVPLNFAWTIPDSYDFSQPTVVNNRVEGSTDVFGPYADIRATRDFAYHGNYTPARQKLQDQLVADIVGGGTRHAAPWIVFTAGAMGAGKSHAINWMSDEGYFPLPDIVQVDLDRFRVQLPEWDKYLERDGEQAGYLTQRESGYCVELAQEKALRMGKNVWIDGSLRDSGWYAKVFAGVRAAHPQYRIAIIHISATWEKVYQRSKSRAEEMGRIVPEDALRQSFEQVPASVANLAPLVDFCATVGNDNDPVLLSVSTGVGEKRGCEGDVCTDGLPPTWEEVRDRFATLTDLVYTGAGSVLSDWVDDLLSAKRVVVFSKSYCSFSTRAKQVLEAEGIDHHVVELDTTFCEDEEVGAPGIAIQVELRRRTGINTVPQIFLQGVFIGDCSRIVELKASGLLKVQFCVARDSHNAN